MEDDPQPVGHSLGDGLRCTVKVKKKSTSSILRYSMSEKIKMEYTL